MWSQHLRSSITVLVTARWAQYLWLGLITLLAAALRFYKLGEWSFWIDEIFTINRAMSQYSNAELIIDNIPPATTLAPISVILTAQVLNIGGINEWSARLVSVVIGVLTIPVLYIPLRKIFGNQVNLIALLLLAISPWHIFWSQNARFYTALMFFYSLALFVFYFAIEEDRPQYFLIFYLLFYLALSERLIAVFLIPTIYLYLFLLWVMPVAKPPGFRTRNILILSIPIIAFLIYGIYVFAASGDLIFVSGFELLDPPIDSPTRLLIIIAFSIGLPIVCLGFFSGISLLLKRQRTGLFFLVSAVLPPIMIALANPFIFTVERYALVSLLFWIVLAASGLISIFNLAGPQNIMLALGLLFILLADMAGENLMYFQINHGNRLQWQEAVEFVRKNMDDQDLVVSTRAPLASYYLGSDTLDFRELSPGNLETIESPIWFIIDYPGIWHGRADSKVWMEEHAQLLQFSYLRVREGYTLLIYRFIP
jgi:mannosyltransferase